MLFAVMGFFRTGVDPEPAALQANFNEHLAQPTVGLRLAGYLRDPNGRTTGFMGLVEADSYDRARAYLENSPYFTAGLYERSEVLEYDVEVGRLR